MCVSSADTRGLARVVVALAVILLSRAAAAQMAPYDEPRPVGAPSIVPPRLKTDSAAIYPEQALRDHVRETATVELLLEIDAAGAVQKATVVESQGHGFDEAALSAASKLVFEPATRDDVLVASRIKFRYTFAPPAPKLSGRVLRRSDGQPITGAVVTVRDAGGAEHTGQTGENGAFTIADPKSGPVHITVTAEGMMRAEADDELSPGEETLLTLRLDITPAALPGAGAESAPVEVVVRGERPPRDVAKRVLSRDEMAHVPGTNGDALRALQDLPGVARPRPFTGELSVRGSAPDDTPIFVDGTPIPLAFHFGALSSVVPTEALDKIDFYPGNFSAHYGRGMGGVVEVLLRDPKKDGLHGIVQADFVHARLLVEGPIGRTGWTFLAAGLRSWFDLWIGPVLSYTGAGVTAAPRYYDYQLMLQNDIDAHSSFRLSFFGSNDELDLLNQTPGASNPGLGGDVGLHTSFWRLQARYENKLAEDTRLNVVAAYGQDSLEASVGSNLSKTTRHPWSARADFSQKLMRGAIANAGIDVLYSPYDLTLQGPPPARAGAPSGGPGQIPVQSRGSHSIFRPAAYIELELVPWSGARLIPGLRADFDSATKGWDIAPRLNVRQDLTSEFPRTTLKGAVGIYDQPPAPVSTDPNFGQAGLSSNRSVQYDIGVEQQLTPWVDVATDLFYKRFENQVVAGTGNSGDGFAYGAEVFLRYNPDGRFFGWLSYTLSQSKRREVPGEPFWPFAFDQTHVLTVLGSLKLGRGWQFGARFRLVSGDPYTPSGYGAYNATVGAQLAVPGYPPNQARLPLFNQVDLRIDRVYTFATWKLSTYFDVQNVSNARNVEGLSYNYNYTQSSHVYGLPILPSFGVRVEF